MVTVRGRKSLHETQHLVKYGPTRAAPCRAVECVCERQSGERVVNAQDADRRAAARKVGCLLGVAVLLLLALPFVMKLWP